MLSEDLTVGNKYWVASKSFDVERSTEKPESSNIFASTGDFFVNLFDTRQVNVYMTFQRMGIILRREFLAMLRRPKMLLGSVMIQISVACLYGIMMDSYDAGHSAPAVTSYFGIGAVLIMLTMLQLAFYLHNNNKVCDLNLNLRYLHHYVFLSEFLIKFILNNIFCSGFFKRTFTRRLFISELLGCVSYSFIVSSSLPLRSICWNLT